MGYRIGDVVWLRRDSGLVELRGCVGTNLGKVGDVWADEDGEHISVVYEDEQILALDLAASEFVTGSWLSVSLGTAHPSMRFEGTACESRSFQV